MTCSIFLLLDAALKKFEGTISTKGCNGPKFFWLFATSIFSLALDEYALTNCSLVSSAI